MAEEGTPQTVPRPVILGDSLHAREIDLEALVSHQRAVQIGDSIEAVFTSFARNQVEFMGVLDGTRLAGICSRHRISELLGGRYGFSLWARKPIGTHLLPTETRVSVTEPIEDVLRKVFARGDDAFYDDVLLVDNSGAFLGLITTQTLFKVQNALLRTNISELVEKEREIQSKNEQMESDLRMAMELQQALMPVQYPRFSTEHARLAFSHHYRPASIIGGDFFFLGRVSESCAGIFICDVMGHGVRSALVTSMLRALIEALGPSAVNPDYLLTELNNELTSILRQTDTVLFVTALYCTIDCLTGELRISRAGHPGPLRLDHANGEVQMLAGENNKNGPALGLLPGAGYQITNVGLSPNDRVLLFTDGIIEVERDDGELFGVDRLIQSLQRNSHRPATLLQDIENDVRFFSGRNAFDDDLCLLTAQWTKK